MKTTVIALDHVTMRWDGDINYSLAFTLASVANEQVKRDLTEADRFYLDAILYGSAFYKRTPDGIKHVPRHQIMVN